MKINQKGFSVVEVVIFMSIFGLIVASGWYVMRNNKVSKNPENIVSTQEAPTIVSESTEEKIDDTPSEVIDTYENWNTFKLKYEKFNIKYPNDYTITDNSSDSNPDIAPGSDRIILTKENGFTISISSGISGVGGGCETCKLALSKEITLFDDVAFLNFRDEGNGAVGLINVATNNTDLFGGTIIGRNIKSVSDSRILPISILLGYIIDGEIVEKTLETINNSTDVEEAIKILASASY